MAIVDTTYMGSAPVEPKAGPEVEVLHSAMKSYCSIKDTSFNDLGGEHGPEAGCVLAEKVNLALADTLCNTRGGRAQLDSAHNVFP